MWHVKSSAIHNKSHQHVVLEVTVTRKIKQIFTCFATDFTLPWLDYSCNHSGGHQHAFNLECITVLIWNLCSHHIQCKHISTTCSSLFLMTWGFVLMISEMRIQDEIWQYWSLYCTVLEYVVTEIRLQLKYKVFNLARNPKSHKINLHPFHIFSCLMKLNFWLITCSKMLVILNNL